MIFYGDKNNWWATYAFWVFQLFGFKNARVLDGGRTKWEQEGRPDGDRRADLPAHEVQRARARTTRRSVRSRTRCSSIRRTRASSSTCARPTSSPARRRTCRSIRRKACCAAGTFRARGACRGRKAANPDGSFKSADELRTIYEKEQGLKSSDDVIAYCRIGERSSHTWFVLTYLLGYEKVRNYDGSWTEWGNSVRVPIETGPGGNV